MKKLCYVATGILVIFHLMTTVIGWPSGDDYSLVLKPYPSLLKEIPHMETRDWNAAVANGKVPGWVTRKHYIELSRSRNELPSPIWARIYYLSCFLAAAALLSTVWFVVLDIRQWLISESSIAPANVV